MQIFSIIEPASATPLIVDSPHSGRIYPDDFKYICPLHMLRQTEDSYVDELATSAAQVGAAVISAQIARSYIDLNRAEDDIDPAVLADPWPLALNPSDRSLLGLGLVRRLCKSGVPVYEQPLPAAEVQKRIENYYRPYHDVLQKTVAQRMRQFGECYLIDCHSMPGQVGEHSPGQRPDFVLGDRSGASADPSFTSRVCTILRDMGFTVALNDPYKGVEIVHRHGHPQAGQHALQLEINRRLYMNEQTLEKTAAFAKLQAELAVFFRTLAADLMRDTADRQAAE
jgi:N-formylglutamate amidohydrolase